MSTQKSSGAGSSSVEERQTEDTPNTDADPTQSNDQQDTDPTKESANQPKLSAGKFFWQAVGAVALTGGLGVTWLSLAATGKFSFFVLFLITVVVILVVALIRGWNRPFSVLMLVNPVLAIVSFGLPMWLAELLIRLDDPNDASQTLIGSFGFFQRYGEAGDVTVWNLWFLLFFLVLPAVFYMLGMAAFTLLAAEPAYQIEFRQHAKRLRWFRFSVPLVIPMVLLLVLASLSLLALAGWSAGHVDNCMYCIP